MDQAIKEQKLESGELITPCVNLKDANAVQGLKIQQLKSEINKLKAQSKQSGQCPVSLELFERLVYLGQGGIARQGSNPCLPKAGICT
jgi:hypothetical protein